MARKKGKGSAFWIVLLLLVMALGGFGVTQFGQTAGTVAKVGDAEISASDYVRAVEAQLRVFQQQTGQQIGFAQARAVGLDRTALGQLITDAAIRNETRRVGLSAGDEQVLNEIRAYPAFQGISGEFDRQTYELALRQGNLSAGEFEDQVRGDLAEGLVRRAVGAGLSAPDVFVDTLYAYARETRDVTWARLTEDDLAAEIADPTEDDISGYYDAHQDAFTRPETKVIHYAWLTPDMLAPDVTVDEDQLRTLYDSRIGEFVQPERRLVERLVFATRADADAAKTRLDSGEADFDALVAERGLDLSDIDLGDVTRADLGAAANDLFALTEPGVAGPLPSDLGPALFRMNGILPAEEVSFEEARDDLQAEAAQDRARRIILDLAPEVEDLLAGGADPALLAERTDMREGRIEWNSDVFDDVAAYEGFRTAAAATTPEDFPEVIELDDGGILTMKVDEVRAPEPIPLDEVRDAVADAWRAEAVEAALVAQAQDIAARLREGAEMAAMDLNLRVNRGMNRASFIEGTPPAFTQSVFGLDADAVTVLSADGDAWLVRLDAINAADGSSPEASAVKGGFAENTRQDYSNAITRAFTQALVDDLTVEINSSAIAAVNAQLP